MEKRTTRNFWERLTMSGNSRSIYIFVTRDYAPKSTANLVWARRRGPGAIAAPDFLRMTAQEKALYRQWRNQR